MTYPRINVTKTFLPPRQEYDDYIQQIWKSGQLTNQGPLLHEFETVIRDYLEVPYFHFVTNGTLALQLAVRVLDLAPGQIITTPFSYVATTSAILWERYEPVFVDIDAETLCIDPSKIEAAITDETRAILAVHVFGRPCDVDAIEKIAKKHNLKVIYDAAHAFGVEYKGRSLLSYGDISICSFHATKVLHTIEGGGLVTADPKLSRKIELTKRFGHNGDDHFMLGFNAKASEFQAAMGLSNMNHFAEILARRKEVSLCYDGLLGSAVGRPSIEPDTTPNYGYYPVVLKDAQQTEAVLEALKSENIYPRRYFYPSLNELPYIANKQSCPISSDISNRILCLPLYDSLTTKEVDRVCQILKKCLK